MIDLYGCYFLYGGFDSSIYGLGITNVDTERIRYLQSTQNINTVRSKRNQRHLLTNVAYDESPMSFDMEITTLDGSVINPIDITMIERSLFNRKSFTEFAPYQEFFDKDPMLHFNCILTNAERIETDGGIVGYKFVVTTDSVMAWSAKQEYTIEIPVQEGDDEEDDPVAFSFVIKASSDMNDYIYPEVTFTTGDVGGDVTLYNNTDDATRFTSFLSLPPNTSFTMRSDINHITNSMYQFFSDRNFIRLLDGDNSFFIMGDIISISFEFYNRIFL